MYRSALMPCHIVTLPMLAAMIQNWKLYGLIGKKNILGNVDGRYQEVVPNNTK